MTLFDFWRGKIQGATLSEARTQVAALEDVLKILERDTLYATPEQGQKKRCGVAGGTYISAVERLLRAAESKNPTEGDESRVFHVTPDSAPRT
jgi:hypothetical protein